MCSALKLKGELPAMLRAPVLFPKSGTLLNSFSNPSSDSMFLTYMPSLELYAIAVNLLSRVDCAARF